MTFTPLPMPEIETNRLLLRGWQENDYACLLDIFTDEETSRYLGGIKTEWQTWRHMASFYGHWHLRGYAPFAIERKEDRKMIGYAGPWYPMGWPEPEIGYALIPSAQGEGFATEAAKACLRYVYDSLRWETCISMIDKNNMASKSVAQKLGATFETTTTMFDVSPGEQWRHLSPPKFTRKLDHESGA